MSKRRRDARRASRRKSQSPGGGMGDMSGMSNKQMQKAIANMDTEEIENVIEVIVRTPTEEIVLKSPEVSIMNVGQEIWSVVPQSVERRAVNAQPIVEDSGIDDVEIEIKEDDVKLIMSTANVTKEKARRALEQSKGDLASAIMSLS
ncbi:MAG: Nascent polypeptide-associated complex protein [Candidatus Heimdallarchaeota archaeon LC_2]|nr:MAG: Nascent polypeptide-associated complex protein [Candidatus Heimdallarchaeota archaeon LC_2]